MGRLMVRLGLVFMAAAAAIVAVFLWGTARFVQPGPLIAPTTVIVPRGLGLEEIAALLSREGVIENPLLFTIGVRLSGGDRMLRAGEYAVPAAVSPRELMRLLQSGETVVRRLTVVEGLTAAQVLSRIAATEGLVGPLPESPGEGRMLPETYHFSYGHDRGAMVSRMVRAMDETLGELWAGRAPGLPFGTRDEALVLASLIEKETGRDDERARIAAVFVNRLKKGMRLQADPTVVYALTDGTGPLDRPLTRADLEVDHPYNTYVVDGLPPGPIANPGRASIAAALNPAESNELYFVADGNGGHVFAKTLEEHNRNAARWRQTRQRLREENADSAGSSPAPSAPAQDGAAAGR
jgi:UPF0755 protein